MSPTYPAPNKPSRLAPFRRAVINGLGVVLPPLLTVVILLWVWGTLDQYVLTYVKRGARAGILYFQSDIRTAEGPPPHARERLIDNRVYRLVGTNRYIPLDVYREVEERLDGDPMPASPHRIYELYVDGRYLRPQVVVPIFLCLFILLMYLLGKLMAAGAGSIFLGFFERGISRVPMIRRVYGSLKQVTDFMLAGSEVEFKRVVAVEYPRRGIWTLGFVMSEGMIDVAQLANEPVLSVLLPTSPMSMTGYTVMVRKSEVYDLTISVEDALQYIVSCGVVVVPHQWLTPESKARLAAKAAAAWNADENGDPGPRDPGPLGRPPAAVTSAPRQSP
jgi:uncharacterized membrane protein